MKYENTKYSNFLIYKVIVCPKKPTQNPSPRDLTATIIPAHTEKYLASGS